MKAIELRRIFDQLNPARKSAVEKALKQYIISVLAYFYEGAQVGDNPLDLDKPILWDGLAGGVVFEITGIEIMFDDNPKGELVLHQRVPDDHSLTATNPIAILSIDWLLILLTAYEEQGFVWGEAFDFNK